MNDAFENFHGNMNYQMHRYRLFTKYFLMEKIMEKGGKHVFKKG